MIKKRYNVIDPFDHIYIIKSNDGQGYIYFPKILIGKRVRLVEVTKKLENNIPERR